MINIFQLLIEFNNICLSISLQILVRVAIVDFCNGVGYSIPTKHIMFMNHKGGCSGFQIMNPLKDAI